MTQQTDLEQLAALIRGISVAMLVTHTADGALAARPMGTQSVDFDGELWFFTAADSEKAAEIAADPVVCVAYADKSDQRYVSVSGRAEILNDRAKMKELWTPLLKVWFDKDVDDPNLRLIRVDVEKAEYWDSPGGTLVTLLGFVKKAVTGKTPDLGENRTIRL